MPEVRDHRVFPRMTLDFPARIRLDGDEQAKVAILKELGGGGILIWLDRKMRADQVFDITVESATELRRPLHARVRVVRCTSLAAGEGGFAVACQLQSLSE
jgi:hypothetical protein